MKFMIVFNGREYFTEPAPEGVNPETIGGKDPRCMFLDFAGSAEDAKCKTERDRERNKVVWY